jgi:hypothetical protein
MALPKAFDRDFALLKTRLKVVEQSVKEMRTLVRRIELVAHKLEDS